MAAQTRQQLKLAKRQVRSLMEQIAGEVAALPEPAIRELLPALQVAERETAAALTRWLATVKNGGERFTAYHYRKVILQLRTAMEAGRRKVGKNPSWLRGIGTAVVNTLTQHGRKGVALSTNHLVDQVATMDAMFGSSLNPIAIQQAAILARGDKMLIPRFRNSAERYTGQVWTDMKMQFAVGVARGETIDQMTNRLRRLGGPKGLVNLGTRYEEIPEGLFRRYKHWADRVVRTEVINAYNVGAQESLQAARKDDPSLKKRWDATMDLRVCITCRDLHGKVAEANAEFPGGYMHPPAHPNCRCASVVWHPSWKEDDKYVEEVLAKREQARAESAAKFRSRKR